MAQVGLTEPRRHPASHIDRGENDRTERVVTRQNRDDLVILPRAERDSLRQTLHILGTPANAARLFEGIAELDAGRGTEHDLIDP